jgi:hypothetical protein
VEPTEKRACCGRNLAVVEIHRQSNLALFQRAAAGAFEKPHLTGEERPLDGDVVMIGFDGCVNSSHCSDAAHAAARVVTHRTYP